MQITYLGHAAFSLKGKNGIVVTDPYSDDVGFKMPKVSADIVTVSHEHFDHNAVERVASTTRRDHPFLINQIGEYEIAGVSVFGYLAYHDAVQGKELGSNRIYVVHIDDIVVAHLGDLGHMLDEKTIEQLGTVDVLLCPVGGKGVLDPKQVVEVIRAIEPSYVIPMHYKTPQHSEAFAQKATLEEFFKAYGVTKEPVPSLTISAGTVPEETELVVLKSP